ncbi:hypothetical protein [Streptosporangium carneum]|nr:hypothetical protein [Streptosporangium carneum]
MAVILPAPDVSAHLVYGGPDDASDELAGAGLAVTLHREPANPRTREPANPRTREPANGHVDVDCRRRPLFRFGNAT